MTMIKHHLDDELLLSYSAGSLPEAFSLVVATHISICDECRARLGSFDAVGGQMLEEVSDVTISDGALGATMKLIRDGDPQEAPPTRIQKPGLLPSALQNYVGGDLDAVNWRRVGLGVKQAVLKTADDASVRLLYIPAGAAMPDHSHRGREITMVLQGAYRDEEDRFARGDVEIAGTELNHTPVAEAGEDCICLTATDAPLKFNSIMPKIAQPFLRI